MKTIDKDDITRNEFESYVLVQMSGQYNMIMNAQDAAEDAGLDMDTYYAIIKNYSYLKNKFKIIMHESVSLNKKRMNIKEAKEILNNKGYRLINERNCGKVYDEESYPVWEACQKNIKPELDKICAKILAVLKEEFPNIKIDNDVDIDDYWETGERYFMTDVYADIIITIPNHFKHFYYDEENGLSYYDKECERIFKKIKSIKELEKWFIYSECEPDALNDQMIISANGRYYFSGDDYDLEWR